MQTDILTPCILEALERIKKEKNIRVKRSNVNVYLSNTVV